MTHNVPNRNWSYPTAIKFGVGRIADLAEHCAAAGVKKPRVGNATLTRSHRTHPRRWLLSRTPRPYGLK